MTASISSGWTGYRGRTGPSSIHRGQAIFDFQGEASGSSLTEPAVLVVELDVEDYIDLRLYQTTLATADDVADSLSVGAEPYADTLDLLEGLVAYDDTAGRTNDRSQNIGANGSSGRIRLYESPPTVEVDGRQRGSAGPYWSFSPGWPDPLSSGNVKWYAHAFPVDDFTDGLAPTGTICRVRCSMSVQIVGTAEFTAVAESPACSWDPDPMWDLDDCIVVRGIIVPRDYEDQGLALKANIDTWDWDSPSRPRAPISVTPETPGVAEVDGAYSGTLNGADVVGISSYYTSTQASEEVALWTVVLGFGIPDEEPPTPGGSGAEPFEFTNRWPIMGPQLITEPPVAADLLERHDQELEQNFADHGCGDFEYTHRWPTFYREFLTGSELAMDILERRDQELEDASLHQGEADGQVNDGSCKIELTHRWREILDLVIAGDARAWDLLEMRDQEIEAGRSACACSPDDPGGG